MRDHKIATTVEEREKQSFREIAAVDGKTMSEKLRQLVYDELESRDRSVDRDDA